MSQTIPKIIHQIWFDFGRGSEIPLRYKKFQHRIKNNNPGYKHYQWNEDKSKDLIEKHYPSYSATYHNLKEPIHKVDYIRYFILHRYGGIYLDMDINTTPGHGFDQFFQDYRENLRNVSIILAYSPVFLTLNGIMMSTKNHPFWIEAMDYVKAKSNRLPWYISWSSPLKTLYLTGPIGLSKVFKSTSHSDVAVVKYILHSKYCNHISHKTWLKDWIFKTVIFILLIFLLYYAVKVYSKK